MAKKELSNAQLEEIYLRVKEDKNFVKTLDQKTVNALMTFIRKRGLKSKAEQFACISWINWAQESMQRAYLLAANGYIARSIREYELDGADAAEVAVIRKFLGSKLGFNADKHVTEGIAANDSREKIRNELGFAINEGPSESFNPIAARDAIRNARNTLKLAAESTAKIPDQIRTVAATILKSPKTVASQSVLRELSQAITDAEQRSAVINRRIAELTADEARLSCAITRDVPAELLELIPPQDNVHGFNRYCADNWGMIKDITRRVYETPGYLDATIFFHGAAKSREDADKLLIRLRDQLPYETAIFADNGPTLIAPDLEDDQLKMKYVDQGDVFTKILDRAEQDNKIASKITGKKMVTSRKKIVIDEFKKNPKKLADARKSRSEGKKIDVSGLNGYAESAKGWVSNLSGPSVTLDDEQEIIDEVLRDETFVETSTVETVETVETPAVETVETDDEIVYGDAVDCAPIGVFGMNAEGKLEKIDVAFDIPAEYTIEGNMKK
jgi:hypothetical protein